VLEGAERPAAPPAGAVEGRQLVVGEGQHPRPPEPHQHLPPPHAVAAVPSDGVHPGGVGRVPDKNPPPNPGGPIRGGWCHPPPVGRWHQSASGAVGRGTGECPGHHRLLPLPLAGRRGTGGRGGGLRRQQTPAAYKGNDATALPVRKMKATGGKGKENKITRNNRQSVCNP